MNATFTVWAAAFGSLLLASAAGSDVLETRDGRILEGTYLGGTQQSIRFETGGSVQVLARDDVLALTFAAKAAAAPARPQAEAAAETAPSADPAVDTTLARVPAGTWLQMRLDAPLDPRSTTAGDAFTATLETALGLDGTPIVPAGSKLHGRVADVADTGPPAQRVSLELTGLTIQGQLVPLVTGSQRLPSPPAAAETTDAAPQDDWPGMAAGTRLEFRLLQPFDLRLR